MKTGDIYTLKEDGSLVIITGFEQLTWSTDNITVLNFKGETRNITLIKLDIRVGHIKDLLTFDASTLLDIKTNKRNEIDFPFIEININ